MTSQHLPSAASRDVISASHRRLVPARIVREADVALLATFDVDIANELTFRSGLDIGVIDTGVVRGPGGVHPLLQGHGAGFEHNIDTDDRTDPAGSYGHGTFVAGVILREAPSARIHMKAALDAATGKWEDGMVARAIRELGNAGVTLINLSFSGNATETEAPTEIVEALEGLGPDVVVVAAAGNNPSSNPVFPAAAPLKGDHPRVVAVGAVDTHESVDNPPVADFSAWGNWVHAFANGRRVFGPHKDSGWILWSGTSFACATVTGRIAAAMAQNSISATKAAALVIDGDGPTVTDVDGYQYPYIPSQASPLTINGALIPN